MSKFTFDPDFYSDLHKDVYGFRPRYDEFYSPETSDERKQEMYDNLVEYSQVVFERERQEEARKFAQFEQDIANIQSVVNCCRDQAIYHYVQSLRPEDYELRDPGYLCYINNLPYALENVIRPACQELLKVEEAMYA